MKRKYLILIAFISLALGVSKQSFGQIEEGGVMIDPYFGVPPRNAFAELLWIDYSTNDDFQRVGMPVTVGGRVEYMLIDELSLGLDVNYASSGFSYRGSYYDESTFLTLNDVLYKYTETDLRVMLRANFYFLRRERFSMYTGLGGGYHFLKTNSTVNGNTLGYNIYERNVFGELPIAARIAIGGKFYFTENVGFNFEFGALGGSIVQLGLALKF